jgi:hypothetical protein
MNIYEFLKNATYGTTAQKQYLIKNGGIESVYVGQKIITMQDGSAWHHVTMNTYQRAD